MTHSTLLSGNKNKCKREKERKKLSKKIALEVTLQPTTQKSQCLTAEVRLHTLEFFSLPFDAAKQVFGMKTKQKNK